MIRFSLIIIVVSILLINCKKGKNSEENIHSLEVELKKFDCNSNLKIVENGVMVEDLQGLNSSNFLYSNIEKYNDGQYKIGDIFTIDFIVLETNPYPVLVYECIIPEGIQIEIIAIK